MEGRNNTESKVSNIIVYSTVMSSPHIVRHIGEVVQLILV